MPDRKWITDKIKKSQERQAANRVHDKLQLRNDQRFDALFPRWLDQLYEELREVLNDFTRQSGKMHAAQVQRTPSGFELVAIGMPDYAINLDNRTKLISYGFKRQQAYGEMLAELRDENIETRSLTHGDGNWLTISATAEMLVDPYLDEAMDKLT